MHRRVPSLDSTRRVGAPRALCQGQSLDLCHPVPQPTKSMLDCSAANSAPPLGFIHRQRRTPSGSRQNQQGDGADRCSHSRRRNEYRIIPLQLGTYRSDNRICIAFCICSDTLPTCELCGELLSELRMEPRLTFCSSNTEKWSPGISNTSI